MTLNETMAPGLRARPAPHEKPIRNPKRLGHWLSYLLGVLVLVFAVRFFVVNPRWEWPTIGSWLFSKRVLSGLLNTVLITVVSTVAGLLAGLVVAAFRLSRFAVLRTMAAAYVWVIRATPGLVLILFVYFLAALVPTLSLGLPFAEPVLEVPTNHVISQFSAAVLGLSAYLGAYSAEIFRGGVLSIHPGQFEACHALGLSPWRTYTKVVGPQIVRVITPSLANEVVTMFKNTSLVSVIGYVELLTTVQLVYSQNFKTIPMLTVAVIWYLVLTSLAMFGQSRLEKRFGRGFTRRSVRSASGDAEREDGHG
ncbi:amino acid ABC transporter permease [Amycolatopsis jiangsuensis]|uniref:Polar amino acid transport system permease protein n=1 Tax=Amycolatopsis jiangsuensis TaxID=1181879 RepID=A0A840IRS7_9PSEU|nr:amino acid ABC transporter permease [Amycolatopsis jiangsuensis]MBB4684087.1 polar amino acid transport system permease protein [Amycolatopsis jiangsuensis]